MARIGIKKESYEGYPEFQLELLVDHIAIHEGGTEPGPGLDTEGKEGGRS